MKNLTIILTVLFTFSCVVYLLIEAHKTTQIHLEEYQEVKSIYLENPWVRESIEYALIDKQITKSEYRQILSTKIKHDSVDVLKSHVEDM